MTTRLIPNFASSWHETWNTYRSHFWVFVCVTLIPQICTAIIVFLISSVIVSDIRAQQSILEVFQPTSFIFYITLLAGVLLFLFQILAAVAVVVTAARRGNIKVMEAFHEARHFVWRSFMVGVASVLITSLVLVAGFVVVSLVTALLVALEVPSSGVWFDWMSILPFILSAAVSVFIIFANMAVVVEKAKVWQSIRRSITLVRPVYWHVALRLLILYIASFICVFAAGYIPYLGGLLAAVIVIPFNVIYLYVLFEQLRTAK